MILNKNDLLLSDIVSIRNHRYKLLFLYPETFNQPMIVNNLMREGIPTININLYLSERLRLISSEKRPYEVARCLKQAISEQKNDVVCLHNIEYLFDTELKQNPVKLLEALSGNIVLLVVWPGIIQHGVLYYASHDHPEYYKNEEFSNHIFTY
jgi:hypothetical protein